MQHQPSTSRSSSLTCNEPAEAVLGLLFDAHPGLVSVDELASQFAGFAGDAAKAHISIHDGLAEVMAAGLAHRLDQFVFASQAAVRSRQLIR